MCVALCNNARVMWYGRTITTREKENGNAGIMFIAGDTTLRILRESPKLNRMGV